MKYDFLYTINQVLIPFFTGLRDYQDAKADVILKYSADEASLSSLSRNVIRRLRMELLEFCTAVNIVVPFEVFLLRYELYMI